MRLKDFQDRRTNALMRGLDKGVKLKGIYMSKKRRGYLKHYNDATQGQSIQFALVKKEYFKIILFWYFVEKLNQANSQKITIKLSEMCAVLRRKRDKMLRECITLPDIFSTFTVENVKGNIHISCDNYAEYQDLRSLKHRSKSAETSPIKDKRVKSKDKRVKIKENKKVPNKIIAEFSSHADFLKTVSAECQRNWIKRHTDVAWLNEKIRDAYDFQLSSGKKYKNIGSYITGWINRSKDKPEIKKVRNWDL